MHVKGDFVIQTSNGVFFNYTPTQDALEINRQRIKERNENDVA